MFHVKRTAFASRQPRSELEHLPNLANGIAQRLFCPYPGIRRESRMKSLDCEVRPTKTHVL